MTTYYTPAGEKIEAESGGACRVNELVHYMTADESEHIICTIDEVEDFERESGRKTDSADIQDATYFLLLKAYLVENCNLRWRTWLELPARLMIGKVDGALCDENGFYVTHEATLAEIVKRYNAFEAMREALEVARQRINAANRDRKTKQGKFMVSDIEAAIALSNGKAVKP